MDEAIEILETYLDGLYVQMRGLDGGRARRDLQIRCDTVAAACLVLRRKREEQRKEFEKNDRPKKGG